MRNAVIVDIDGTISKVGERLKYLKQTPKNWDKFYDDCFDDEPIYEMLGLISLFISSEAYNIVFCTGRREAAREKTQEWLYKYLGYRFGPDRLLMRPDDDKRPDKDMKPDLVHGAGITFKDIAFVLEDRASMVKQWRSLGVRCLQVDEGEF